MPGAAAVRIRVIASQPEPEVPRGRPSLHTARCFEVNLDPGHPRFAPRGLPTRLPLPDGVADLVFALEIVEHLVDPAHLFDEARRLLKPGGALVITTPNIARIGSVMKLLAGRTNLEDVHPPTSERGGADWAPHLREYAPGELRAIAARAGFSAVGARCFRNEETDFTHRTPARRAIDLVKWGFGVVPHLRGSLLLVARR